MASHINRGESLLIPFRNGKSITDSQLKPRMYKTMQAFEKSFPGHYLGTDGVELAEYVEVVHGRWIKVHEWCGVDVYRCSACGREHPRLKTAYCCDCGAKMNGGNEDG